VHTPGDASPEIDLGNGQEPSGCHGLSIVDTLCVMAIEVRADPDELARLASDTLTASEQLGDGHRDAFADLAVPSSAFGNTTVSASVYGAHEAALASCEVTVARLVIVQESDVDRLYGAAFAYQQADAEANARLVRIHRAGF
jgi:hypothetical protein